MTFISPHLTGWVALCLVPRIGGRTLSALLTTFGSPNAVFEASEAALLTVPLIGPRTVTAIQQIDLMAVEHQIKSWLDDGITLLGWTDERYPAPLLALGDRPPLLFSIGELTQNWDRVIAIVGTREPDLAAEKWAEMVGYELAQRGWLVVSGLARGIDAAAHRGALQGGRTVAFLGCGVSNVHPHSSRDIARRLLRQGAIYAEVPPETAPTPAALMARNRLISGLAKATIVVQAGIQSGSMEAARRARLYQRTVITLDNSAYDGNQALIRMGAVPLQPDFQDWDAMAHLLENLPDPPRQLSFFD